MLTQNILLIIPAIMLLLYQTQFIWGRLPKYNRKETQIEDKYSLTQLLMFIFGKYFLYTLFAIQLFTTVLPISNDQSFHLIILTVGYTLVISGFLASITALKELGYSWTSMILARIKIDQKLITSGIYKYFKHPIYLSAIIEVVGFELILNSWLFIPVGILLSLVIAIHIRREERILVSYYKDKYLDYNKSVIF